MRVWMSWSAKSGRRRSRRKLTPAQGEANDSDELPGVSRRARADGYCEGDELGAMSWELLAYALANGLTAALSAWGVIESRRDLAALQGVPRNGRWMVARHQLLRYGLRLVSASVIGMVIFVDVNLAVILLIVDRIVLALTTLSDLLTGAFLRRGVRQYLEEQTTHD